MYFDINMEKYFVLKNRSHDTPQKVYADMENKCEVLSYEDCFAQNFENIHQKHDIFIDPVADYMESFFGLSFQPCLHCEKQIHC